MTLRDTWVGWFVLKDIDGECGPRVPGAVGLVLEERGITFKISAVNVASEREARLARVAFLDDQGIELCAWQVGLLHANDAVCLDG